MIAWISLMARLAGRNILRQARRSTLTAAAMVIGAALLMMSRTLADGAHEDWIRTGVRLGTGHIAIQAPGYLRSRRIEDRLSADRRTVVEAALRRSEVAAHVTAIAPRLATGGLASSPTSARPVHIVGVDPIAEREFSIFDDKLVEGRYLKPDDRLAAYVGVQLVERLDLELGSRMVITAQDATGEIAGQLVHVRGTFRTGIPEVDGGVIQIPLATAGAWLAAEGDVTAVAVLLESSRDVGELRATIASVLTRTIPPDAVRVLDWREAMPDLDATLRLDDYGDYLFHTILFAIIALAIVNAVLMSVLQRTREFGVLQALGLTPRETGGLVLTEGILLTAVSGVIGVAIGLFITWFFWRDGLDLSFLWSGEMTAAGVVIEPVMVPEFRLKHIVLGLGYIGIIGTLASLYPAYRAARIDVATAMKFER